MVILGIDPGYGIVGFGALNLKEESISLMEYGAITTGSELAFCERLNLIFKELTNLLERIKPDVMVVEKLFFRNNQKTAIDVAQARGVIILAGTMYGALLKEFTPLQVKMAVTGYGRSKKPEIMQKVKEILNLEALPKPDDAADAVALAICYAKILKSEWKSPAVLVKEASII